MAPPVEAKSSLPLVELAPLSRRDHVTMIPHAWPGTGADGTADHRSAQYGTYASGYPLQNARSPDRIPTAAKTRSPTAGSERAMGLRS